jgi:hypothetical protein
MFCIFVLDPSRRECGSRLPGAWSLDTLGVKGVPLYFDLMPLAEARLLAIEDDISRRCWDRVGFDPVLAVLTSLDPSLFSPGTVSPAFSDPPFSLTSVPSEP